MVHNEKGLLSVWGFEIRQPGTEFDDCNTADILFFSQINNVLMELKLNNEQKLMLTTSSPNCSKPMLPAVFIFRIPTTICFDIALLLQLQ